MTLIGIVQLDDNPAIFFILDEEDSDDPISGQLRAAQTMSTATAEAFMDIIRAAYAQVLAETDNEDVA